MNTTEIYNRVTQAIIDMLENKGKLSWSKSWEAFDYIPLRSSGQPYRGVNILSLWVEAEDKGYSSPYWFTFNQCKELKGNVKGGAKGYPIIYYRNITEESEDDTEELVAKPKFILKTYTVFNADQCEGLEDKYYHKADKYLLDNTRRDHSLDKYFHDTGAKIVEAPGDKAFYTPSLDYIRMPIFSQFKDSESFYSVLAHEVIHWTGHKTRLDRLEPNAKANDAYEELIAELGNAFLCAELGISKQVRQDHGAYIQSWLEVLKNDNRLIFKASAAAQKAVTYVKETVESTRADNAQIAERA